MEVLKDKDCTINTPVVLGVQDSPIYGKGISIKPRVDGRKDSKHFESIYLPELLPLEEYDLIVVLISGGKDSIACFYKLLELGVGFTLDNKKNLDDFICGAKSCLCLDDKQAVHSIKTGEFTVDDIFVDDWKYPVGAFHGSDGGSC